MVEVINSKENRFRTLTHYLSRDAPLVAIESWYKGRMYNFVKYTGITYPVTLFMHKNNVFRFYIDTRGFEEKLPVDISNWIRSNEKKFMNVKAMMNKSLKNINKIKNSLLTTAPELINALRKVAELWSNVYIGVLLSHHLPMFHENFMKKNIRLFEERIVNETTNWRKADGNVFFNEGVEVMNDILNKIAKFKKYNPENLKYFTLEELEKFVKTGKLPKNKLMQRHNSTYIYFKDRVIVGKNIKKFLNKSGVRLYEEEICIDNPLIITGSVANKGMARGKARIIVNRNELKKFNDSDIIIAHMTSPWYVPIMEKAAAIVTDEGGITCHAAIISREMNKPCIIGTKYATKVIKDGDFVEVDANKGIVRKLK